MHIVAFSMTPLYPNRVMGGAQKQLYTVVMHLARLGHRVTVLCTRRQPDAVHPFQWHDNATVRPVFRFKQPYPEPYAAPIYDLAAAVQTLSEYLHDADVFYSHDGGFIFPYVHAHVPTVVSLRSVIFSETLQSAFLFQGDDLILISQHQRDTLLQTVGRFFPALQDRTHIIYNGLDFDHFQPTAPLLIPEADPKQHAIVLFPHRPEAPKGIYDAIEVAQRLVYTHGIHNLRVLVPRWLESALSPIDRAFYDDLMQRITDKGLQEHFVFHEWVSQRDMPAYYSLGQVTLAIGSYVETFGNVPYESLACGTPAIVSKVGPARELLPDSLMDKIAYGDHDHAAQIAARIIHNNEGTAPDTLRDLRTRFQQPDMAAAYADVILNATKRPPLSYQAAPTVTADTHFVLPAWVYRTDDGRLYHDFRAEYQAETTVHADPMTAYAQGWLVPAQHVNTFYLSLGSSQNANENLPAIVKHLRERVRVIALSSVYASKDAKGGNTVYLNAAAVIESPLSAERLKLDVLRPIEQALGRVKGQPTVTADLDIIMMNDAVISYLGRTLPDPDLLRRAFVALPMAEIAPNVQHPITGDTLQEIAARFQDAPIARRHDLLLNDA